MNEGLVIYEFYNLPFILANSDDPDETPRLRIGFSGLNVYFQLNLKFAFKIKCYCRKTVFHLKGNTTVASVGEITSLTLKALTKMHLKVSTG